MQRSQAAQLLLGTQCCSACEGILLLQLLEIDVSCDPEIQLLDRIQESRKCMLWNVELRLAAKQGWAFGGDVNVPGTDLSFRCTKPAKNLWNKVSE